SASRRFGVGLHIMVALGAASAPGLGTIILDDRNESRQARLNKFLKSTHNQVLSSTSFLLCNLILDALRRFVISQTPLATTHPECTTMLLLCRDIQSLGLAVICDTRSVSGATSIGHVSGFREWIQEDERVCTLKGPGSALFGGFTSGRGGGGMLWEYDFSAQVLTLSM
ncbi:hypothetical protein EV363DRAFT_1145277, partial [Boletus edulis]